MLTARDAQQDSITITIVLQPTGQIDINGPLKNKVLFLGLLESAKEAALKMWMTNDSRIAQPPTGVAGLWRRMNGGD